MESVGEYIDLLTLQRHIKATLEGRYTRSVWVKAEISSLKVGAAGHCYLELSESDSRSVVAKVRATIWSSRYYSVSQHFRSVTGTPLAVGQEILALCQVTYHEIYGFSINVIDINPEFTLGAGEALRRRTLERLRGEGLMDMQKRLAESRIPYRLAVISAEGAAGYGDFRKHLMGNEYGFAYDVVLFPATMQGREAPSSIVAAIAMVLASSSQFDALLILRGGGSELDLACFDDYDLAVAIARCPLPVYTAIGHERDNHVADMVAHACVKTPTALADLFIDATLREDEMIASLENRLRVAFSSSVEACDAAISSYVSRIFSSAHSMLERAAHSLEMCSRRVSSCLTNRIVTQSYKVSSFEATIRARLGTKLVTSDSELEGLWQRLVRAASARLAQEELGIVKLEYRMMVADPRSVLQKGRTLVLDSEGVGLYSVCGVSPGDAVTVLMRDGRMSCRVEAVERMNDNNTIQQNG